MPNRVPELSLADYTDGSDAARNEFCDALMRGLKQYGFIILRDHPIAADLLERAYGLAEHLFALPEEEKRSYVGGVRGYTPFGTEHAKDHAVPDLKEFWHVGRELDAADTATRGDTFQPNIWPARPEGFKETFTTLYDALDRTGKIILDAITPGLDLPRGWFDPLVREGNAILRILHYPPIPGDADPHAIRAAAHEDINFITLLVAAKGAGLELFDRDGSWLPVETDPGNLIVDSGDMMARLTNGVVPATTHRVVNPTGPNVSRYSMPFFMHPADDVVLKCLPSCVGVGEKWPPITAGDFLAERLEEIGLTPTGA